MIVLGIFGLSFAFFGATSAEANTVFNTHPNDPAHTVMVSNVTACPGCTNAWYPSINANPGDTIAVMVYYHNTGSQTATGTYIKMSPQNVGATQNATFTGGVGASNASFVGDSAQVHINGGSPQTLTYISGMTRWYSGNPITNDNTYYISSQQVSALFGSGYQIGSVLTDLPSCPTTQTFCHQGSVVARFKVSNNITPPPPPPVACSINYFSANPSSVSYNGSSTLSWDTTGTTGTSVAGIGSFNSDDSTVTGPIQSTRSYTLTANCQDGTTRTKTVTVSVAIAPSCSATFTANDTSITSGQSAVLTWNSTNASGVTISPSNGTHLGTSGSITVSPTTTTTYTLTVDCNNGNTIVRTITITVAQPQVLNCKINSFSAAPSTVPYGSPANLYWTTANCNDVSITNLGSQMLSGSTSTGNLIATTTFTLTADGNGPTQTKVVTVYVSQQPSQGYCAITSFNASPASVNYADTTTLTWATTNDCSNVSISSIGNVGTSGSVVTNALYATTHYTLSASILGGAIQTRSIVVNVNIVTQPTFQCSDSFDNDGDGLTDFPNDPGCTSPTDNSEYNSSPQTYQCSDGIDNDGDGKIDFPHDPGCTSLTDNSEYNSTQSTYQCNDGYDNDGDGQVDYPHDPGCTSYSDNSEYNNVICCTPPPQPQQMQVTTLVASSVSNSSAVLNGLLTFSGYGCSTCLSMPAANTVYFEYGTTTGLGTGTQWRNIGGTQSFNQQITGLFPSTTYYFRAVANTGSGKIYGTILSFRTLGSTYNGPIIIYTGGGSGSGDPLMTLEIDSRYETVSVGDSIDYTVKYKNISKRTTLKNVVLHIQFPENVIFERSTRGEYSAPDKTLTLEIGTVAPQEEDTFFIQVKVDRDVRNGDILVTSGTLAYTTPSNIQYDIVAYEVNTVAKDTVNFLAGLALFGADGLLPGSLIGWLILILVVLLIIMLARRTFGSNKIVTKTYGAPTHLPH